MAGEGAALLAVGISAAPARRQPGAPRMDDVGTRSSRGFASASLWTFPNASSSRRAASKSSSASRRRGHPAERHSRTKDDFVAVLSHELRNPLNAIGGWVHVLKTGNRSPDLVEKGLTAIDRSVKAQARLISDILDVSRISSGKLRLYPEWSEPRALVASSIEALSVAIAAKHLRVQFEHEEAEQPAWLDPTRFQQIVWNLLSNAVKFSNEGGLIRIGLAREADRLALSVRTAAGRHRPPNSWPICSTASRRAIRRTTGCTAGLGLGLSIVKNLAGAARRRCHRRAQGRRGGHACVSSWWWCRPTGLPGPDGTPGAAALARLRSRRWAAWMCSWSRTTRTPAPC